MENAAQTKKSTFADFSVFDSLDWREAGAIAASFLPCDKNFFMTPTV